MQTKLIFPAQKLARDPVFPPHKNGREVAIRTGDGLSLSGMQYRNFNSGNIILTSAVFRKSKRFYFGFL